MLWLASAWQNRIRAVTWYNCADLLNFYRLILIFQMNMRCYVGSTPTLSKYSLRYGIEKRGIRICLIFFLVKTRGRLKYCTLHPFSPFQFHYLLMPFHQSHHRKQVVLSASWTQRQTTHCASSPTASSIIHLSFRAALRALTQGQALRKAGTRQNFRNS